MFRLPVKLGARAFSSQRTINWVLTHEPIALFQAAADEFTELVQERSHGELDVKVFTPVEYGEQIGLGRRATPLEVTERVATGELQMSQTYTTVLGQVSDRMWLLDLPFLFQSHEHASKVLDGSIGKQLLDELANNNLKGLGFTYSGGYRILSSTEHPITSIEDIQGVNVRTSDNPVVTKLFRELGAIPHPAPLQSIPTMTASGQIEAAESTWPRYWDMEHFEAQPIVNETSHSLFLTVLSMNLDFFRSLSQPLQNVVTSSAMDVAIMERTKSVKDGDAARATWKGRGGLVTSLSESEQARWHEASAAVYAEFGPRFGWDIINAIRAVADLPAIGNASVESVRSNKQAL